MSEPEIQEPDNDFQRQEPDKPDDQNNQPQDERNQYQICMSRIFNCLKITFSSLKDESISLYYNRQDEINSLASFIKLRTLLASGPVFLALNTIQLMNGAYFNFPIYFFHLFFTLIGYVAIIFQQFAKNHDKEKDILIYQFIFCTIPTTFILLNNFSLIGGFLKINCVLNFIGVFYHFIYPINHDKDRCTIQIVKIGSFLAIITLSIIFSRKGRCSAPYCEQNSYCTLPQDLNGFFRNTNGTCTQYLPHCIQQKEENKCEMCQESIAKMNPQGKCSICNTTNGWSSIHDEYCFCDYFVVPNQEHKCLQCDSIFPHCSECKFSDKQSSFQENLISKEIGEYFKKPQYLSCVQPKQEYYFYEPVSSIYDNQQSFPKVIRQKPDTNETQKCNPNCNKILLIDNDCWCQKCADNYELFYTGYTKKNQKFYDCRLKNQ